MKFLLAVALALAGAPPALSQDDVQVSQTSVKFFEANHSPPRQKQRAYAVQFERSKTRYVYTEFAGTNLQYRKRDQAVSLVFRYFQPDGEIFTTIESNLDLPADWAGFFTAKGSGFSRRGKWTGGVYRVEVHSGGKKLCEGAFTIHDDVAERPPFAATPAENVKIAADRRKIEDAEGALLFCGRALEQDEAFAEAYEVRAEVMLDQGKLDDALADAAKAIECDPARPDAHHLLARSLARSGRAEEAVKEYGRAIELNPSKAVYYRNRALSRKSLLDYEKSLADVERCLQLDATYADAFNDRGLLRRRAGDFIGALEDFSRAIKLNPGHSYAHNNRGELHLKRGARYQARLDFEAAIQWGGDAVRADAAESLGELGLTDAADTLAGLLWDDDATVRRKAVWSMGRLKSMAHASEIGRLLGDADPAVRRSAAIAIGEVDGRDFESDLEALVGQDDAVARVHAIFTLCRFGVARHAQAAVDLLSHADVHLRGDAIEALGFLGDKQYAAAIASFLKDAEADVRIKAAMALGRLGAREHAAGIAELLDDPAMGSLYDAGTADWKDSIISDVAARTLRDWDLDPVALRPKRTPTPPRPVAGTYAIADEGDPAKPRGEITIGAVGDGGRFEIEGKDWKGRGVVTGDRGYYDWKFLDGSTGRTTFTVDAEGRLHGRVVGGGVDWKYLGTKK
jgi:HEAT repeat protein